MKNVGNFCLITLILDTLHIYQGVYSPGEDQETGLMCVGIVVAFCSNSQDQGVYIPGPKVQEIGRMCAAVAFCLNCRKTLLVSRDIVQGKSV